MNCDKSGSIPVSYPIQNISLKIYGMKIICIDNFKSKLKIKNTYYVSKETFYKLKEIKEML